MDPEDAADRDGNDLFVALTHRGICQLYGPLQTGVTIWTLKDSYERGQVAFAKLRKPRPRRRRKQS